MGRKERKDNRTEGGREGGEEEARQGTFERRGTEERGRTGEKEREGGRVERGGESRNSVSSAGM